MLDRIKQVIAPPVFEGDEDRIRTARQLNAILWVILILPIIIGPVAVLVVPSGVLIGPLMLAFTFLLTSIAGLVLIRRGWVRLVGIALTAIMFVALTGAMIIGGGVALPSYAAYMMVILVAGVAVGKRAAVIVSVLSILVGLALVLAGRAGLLPSVQIEVTPTMSWVVNSTLFAVGVSLLYMAVGSLDDALARAREYAAALGEQQERLEEVVEERTRALVQRTRYLEATADVTRNVASILDEEELLTSTVTSISDAFGLYRMGVFLTDPQEQWAVLRAVSGAGGQQLADRSFRLEVRGRGIVPHVIRSGQAYLASNVLEDPLYFDDQEMGDTRSEVTVPLRARGEVIGALSVQSAEFDAFGDEDVTALQTVSDQVAMAISNARLYSQAQESLEAERRALGEVGRAGWRDLLHDRPRMGYRRDAQGTSLAGDVWRPEMAKAVRTGSRALGGDESKNLALPITSGGRVIGVIDARRATNAGEWTDDEIEIVEALTEQLGVVLEGARLFGDTQRRAAEERMVSEVTTRMRETLDVRTVLESAADELYQTLGLDKVEIRMAPRGNGEPA